MFSTRKPTPKNSASEISGETFQFCCYPFLPQSSQFLFHNPFLGTLQEGMLWFSRRYGFNRGVIPLLMKKSPKKETTALPENREDDREKLTNAIAGATLSILGGMGHLYLGVERRGYFLLACSLALILISKFYWPTGWLIYGQWVILTGFDAFAFGKRGRGFF